MSLRVFANSRVGTLSGRCTRSSRASTGRSYQPVPKQALRYGLGICTAPARHASVSLRAYSPSAEDLTKDIQVKHPDNMVEIWSTDQGDPWWSELENGVFVITIQGYDEGESQVYGNSSELESGEIRDYIVAFEDGSDAHRHANWIKAKTPHGDVRTFVSVLSPLELKEHCGQFGIGASVQPTGTELEVFNPLFVNDAE
ncbi:hypothetical protein CYMTET_20856 [Cymbomonas tetramitiformis]|uniref:Uncharacterized protein n=1 Tax=Cymbomonas tetramitiformis TaxID=36881 RepID=A0AAE0G391_9CHLO|nr:hypothetical protein CYMTET_20856 [Cymbomonas tetramitiformis]